METISKNDFSEAIELHKEWQADHQSGKRLILFNVRIPKIILENVHLNKLSIDSSEMFYSFLKKSVFEESNLGSNNMEHSSIFECTFNKMFSVRCELGRFKN